MKSEGGTTTLVTVLPGAILGPVLSPDGLGSVQIVQRMLNGKMPGTPRVGFSIVDVRDLIALHIQAMTDPAAFAAQVTVALAADDPMAEHLSRGRSMSGTELLAWWRTSRPGARARRLQQKDAGGTGVALSGAPRHRLFRQGRFRRQATESVAGWWRGFAPLSSR